MSSWQCGGCGRWYNYTVSGCNCHITYATSGSSGSATTPTNIPSTPVAADKYMCAKCGWSGSKQSVREHKCGEWPQPAHVG